MNNSFIFLCSSKQGSYVLLLLFFTIFFLLVIYYFCYTFSPQYFMLFLSDFC